MAQKKPTVRARPSPARSGELPRASARFINPMLLLRTDALPSSNQWLYELKLDGYRAIAFKRQGRLYLRSRNNKDFSARYPAVVAGLAKLSDDTVIDGEIVAFDDDGRPSFNALQNFGSAPAPVVHYVFDVMVLAGRDVMREPLETRLELLERKVLPKLKEPIRYAAALDTARYGAQQPSWSPRERDRIRRGTPGTAPVVLGKGAWEGPRRCATV